MLHQFNLLCGIVVILLGTVLTIFSTSIVNTILLATIVVVNSYYVIKSLNKKEN